LKEPTNRSHPKGECEEARTRQRSAGRWRTDVRLGEGKIERKNEKERECEKERTRETKRKVKREREREREKQRENARDREK